VPYTLKTRQKKEAGGLPRHKGVGGRTALDRKKEKGMKGKKKKNKPSKRGKKGGKKKVDSG